MSIKADGTRHGIVMAKVGIPDSGLYTVHASNRAGEASSRAELLVSALLNAEPEAVAPIRPSLKLNINCRPPVSEESQPDGLVPEPPPEVAFAKKPETPAAKLREDFVEKTRILELASQIISPTEVPGGIRLLPLPVEDSPKIIPPPIKPETSAFDLKTPQFQPFPELEPFPFTPDPP